MEEKKRLIYPDLLRIISIFSVLVLHAVGEIWGDIPDILTADEWIDVYLKNYKCKKYLFVVDKTEKYKDNIVEKISNKSHFSNNCEYVVLINRNLDK